MVLIYLTASKQTQAKSSKIIVRSEIIHSCVDSVVRYEVSQENTFEKAKLAHLAKIIDETDMCKSERINIFCDSQAFPENWEELIKNEFVPIKNRKLWQDFLSACYQKTKHIPVFIAYGILTDSARSELKNYINLLNNPISEDILKNQLIQEEEQN